MFCTNCGNKLDENAYVCVNCGVLLKKRSEVKIVKRKKNTDTVEILSIVFSVIAVILSLSLFFYDISSVGMYTEIYERIFFVLEYSLSAIVLTIIAFILSLIGKKNNHSKVAFILSLLSLFFIITEIVVVIIY